MPTWVNPLGYPGTRSVRTAAERARALRVGAAVALLAIACTDLQAQALPPPNHGAADTGAHGDASGALDAGAARWSNERLAAVACPRARRCGAPVYSREGCCVGCGPSFRADMGRTRAIAVINAIDCAAIRALWAHER